MTSARNDIADPYARWRRQRAGTLMAVLLGALPAVLLASMMPPFIASTTLAQRTAIFEKWGVWSIVMAGLSVPLSFVTVRALLGRFSGLHAAHALLSLYTVLVAQGASIALATGATGALLLAHLLTVAFAPYQGTGSAREFATEYLDAPSV